MERLVWAGSLLIACGCAVTSPRGAATSQVDLESDSEFTFSTGQGSRVFHSPVSQVGPRVAEALTDLGMTDVEATRDGAVVRYEARTHDGRSASVVLRSRGGASVASTRVGLFGDRPFSRTILDRVAIRLGERPPEVVPQEIPSAPASNPFFSRSAVTDSDMLREQADAIYSDRVIP